MPCPNCGCVETRTVYGVRRIPIHSCVLLEDAQAARSFPTGDLSWTFCESCTFLFNADFDPARMDYSSDYEETQGFSGTFTRWLEGVGRALIERYDLRGKRILEIGCGRGDFLELVARLGDAEGIGVDPSATAGRVDHSAGRGLRFLQEEFGPEHAGLAPDAIVCRHTLEHLRPARELLANVHAALMSQRGADEGGIAFFEVPDVERQLVEGAFWDVYYEHCAYYGEASLRALFEASGFRVEALERVYGDQYLQIAARAVPTPGGPRAPRVEDPATRERWRSLVQGFAESCEGAIGTWNAFRSARGADRERVVLWGSGSKATGFLSTLGWDTAPDGLELVVDINPDKWERFVAGSGQRIAAPKELSVYRPRHVVVMNPIYVEEIAADLAELSCGDVELHPLGK